MYYAAMVVDVNPIAEARVDSAYISSVPGAYFDAGYEVMVGGGVNLVPYYEPLVNSSAQRAVPPLDFLTALDWLGNNTVRVHVAIGNGVPANTAPSVPSTPVGGVRARLNEALQFTTEAVDPDANMVYYQWDWGDGQTSEWFGENNSGDPAAASHSWTEYGEYQVRVKVRDPFGQESAWSPALSVTVACCSGRVGDANQSGEDEPTIGDVSVLIDARFISGSCDGIVTCLAEADINQSGGSEPTCDDVTIGDISILIDYLFITGSSLGLPNCL